MDNVKFYTRYGNRLRVAIDFDGVPTRTKQQFSRDCDINNIMARYKASGTLVDPSVVNMARAPRFDDVSNVLSYHEMRNRIALADSAFARLPSDVRREFGNDPAVMLEFMSDPANVDRCVELGLLDGPAQQAPDAPQATPPHIKPSPEPSKGDPAPDPGS